MGRSFPVQRQTASRTEAKHEHERQRQQQQQRQQQRRRQRLPNAHLKQLNFFSLVLPSVHLMRGCHTTSTETIYGRHGGEELSELSSVLLSHSQLALVYLFRCVYVIGPEAFFYGTPVLNMVMLSERVGDLIALLIIAKGGQCIDIYVPENVQIGS